MGKSTNYAVDNLLENKTYLEILITLAQSGPTTIMKLSVALNKSHTKVYGQIKKLENKGWVKYVNENKHRSEVAIVPENIILQSLLINKWNVIQLEQIQEHIQNIISVKIGTVTKK